MTQWELDRTSARYVIMFRLSLILCSLSQVNTDMMSNSVYLLVIISSALLYLTEPSFGLYCIILQCKKYFIIDSKGLESWLPTKKEKWVERVQGFSLYWAILSIPSKVIIISDVVYVL